MRHGIQLFLLTSVVGLLLLTDCAIKSQPCSGNSDCTSGLSCLKGNCQRVLTSPETALDEEPTPEPRQVDAATESPNEIQVDKASLEEPHQEAATQDQVHSTETPTEISPPTDIPDKRTPTKPCDLHMKVKEIDFYTVATGTYYDVNLAVYNRGGPCVIRKMSTLTRTPKGQSAFHIITTLPPSFTVGAQGDFLLTLRFQPLSPQRGQWEGQLHIESDSPTQPKITLPLKGETLQLNVSYFPKVLDFANVQIGCKAYHTLRFFLSLFTTPNTNIKFVKIGLSATTSAAFKLTQVPLVPASLSLSQPLLISLAYQPLSASVATGSLEIFVNTLTAPLLRIPLRGEGRVDANHQEVFKQFADPKVDILFVINTTVGGMAGPQAYLKKQASTFLDRGLRLKADFHLGVISSSLSSITGPVGCLLGLIKNVTASTLQPAKEFEKNLPLTTGYLYPISGLEASHIALTRPLTLNSQCNQGFLRKDALLSVIQVSNTPDGYNKEYRSLDFYRSFYKQLKGRQHRDLFRFSTWSGPPPMGCRDKSTNARASPRYWTLAKEFQGVAEPLCDLKPAIFQKLADITFRFRSHFALEGTPKPGTLVVKVNGKALNVGWRYDATDNAIIFENAAIPPPNASILVSYKSLCLS